MCLVAWTVDNCSMTIGWDTEWSLIADSSFMTSPATVLQWRKRGPRRWESNDLPELEKVTLFNMLSHILLLCGAPTSSLLHSVHCPPLQQHSPVFRAFILGWSFGWGRRTGCQLRYDSKGILGSSVVACRDHATTCCGRLQVFLFVIWDLARPRVPWGCYTGYILGTLKEWFIYRGKIKSSR